MLMMAATQGPATLIHVLAEAVLVGAWDIRRACEGRLSWWGCAARSHSVILAEASRSESNRNQQQACKAGGHMPVGPMLPPVADAIAFWLDRKTAEGLGYGRLWNSGPDAVVSAAVGWKPSRPLVHPPRGASE